MTSHERDMLQLMINRVVESVDRLTQVVERIEQSLPHPPLMMHTYHSYSLDERAGGEGKEWSSGIATTAEVKAALGDDHL